MTELEFEHEFIAAVRDERRATTRVLILINLAQDRKFHLKRGFPSLFAWLTEDFKYSNAAAQRRIDAAKALRNVPAVTEMLKNGSLSLSVVAKAESAIKREEKTSGQKFSKEEHAEILSKLENKSCKEAEKTLFTMFPEASKRETQKRISEKLFRLTLELDAGTMEDLEWLKDHWSHIFPEGKFADLIKRAARNERERCQKPVKEPDLPDHEIIGARAKKIAFQRAEGKCEMVDSKTGRTSGSKYQAQVDHIIPLALGGLDNLANMRCLCRAHNLYMAETKLGKSWANHWRQ